MLLVRSLVFDAAMYGMMALMGLIAAPYAAVSRRGARRVMKLYCRAVFALLHAICGLRVEIRGAVPRGPVLVAAKHQSFLDVMMLMHALPEPRFVMKAELARVPVLGFYARRIGCVAVARGGRGAAVRRMVKAFEGGEVGGQIVIYPQGTRAPPGARLPYKIGAGALYERLGLACIPAATNAGVFWGRRSLLRHPGVAVLIFLPEIAAGQDLRAFMVEIEARIEGESEALAVEGERPRDR